MPILDITVRVQCEECRAVSPLVFDRARSVGFCETADDLAREAALNNGFYEIAPGDWLCYRCVPDEDDD